MVIKKKLQSTISERKVHIHISPLSVWFTDLRNMDYVCYLHKQALLESWHSVNFYLGGPQIVLLGNTEHLSQLNCHTNRFLSDVQFVLGSMPAKTKVSNLKQQTSPCADRNKLLYSKWIRITVDHRSSVWALHKGWKNVPQINSFW